MSIFGTWWTADDDDHLDGCDVWEEIEPGISGFSGKPCSLPDKCTGEPYIYEGSHLIPDRSKRGGYAMACAIPAHIATEHVPTEKYPAVTLADIDFIRLSVSQDKGEGSTVLLDRKQVKELAETLTKWLERGSDA